MFLHRLSVCSIGLACLALCTVGVHAQATPQEAVRTFIDGFNSSDMAKAAAVNSAGGTSIIDEFAPFSWSGPKAFEEWGAGFEATSKALGITEPKVTLGAPVVANKNPGEDQAYLIYPVVYTYKVKGAAMREPARLAVVLRKESSAWKIAAWAWTGTVPKPVK
jgi:hypothetical protein